MTGILALDLATTTGWASVRAAGPVVFSSFEIAEPGTDVGPFLARYYGWLNRKLDELGAPASAEEAQAAGPVSVQVVFEAPFVGGQTSNPMAAKLFGLSGVTEMICHQRGLPCYEVLTGPVTLHFTGDGGGKREDKKARTIEACRTRGFNPANDDEADAIAILDYAAHLLGVKTDIPDGPLFARGRNRGKAA